MSDLPDTIDPNTFTRSPQAAAPVSTTTPAATPEHPETINPNEYTRPGQQPTTGMWPNVGAAVLENVAPTIANTIASPFDFFPSAANAAIQSARGGWQNIQQLGQSAGAALGLNEPPKPSDWLTAEKEIAQTPLIPARPVGDFLTEQAHQRLGMPTPEHPIESIQPANKEEALARRAVGMATQAAGQIFLSRGFGKFAPTEAPAYQLPSQVPRSVQIPKPTSSDLLLGFIAPTKVYGSAPALSTGAIAASPAIAEHYIDQYGKDNNWSKDEIDNAKGIARALTVVGGAAAQTGFSALGEATGANNLGRTLFKIPSQEILANYSPPWISKPAETELIGRALEGTPLAKLAEHGGWQASTADVPTALKDILSDRNQASQKMLQLEQSVARGELAKVGGTATDLQSHMDQQLPALQTQIGGMRVAPEKLGAQLRAGIGSQAKTGPIAEIMKREGKDFTLPNSDVPSRIFNENLTPEDLSSMLHRAKGGFRDAFRDAGTSNFLDFVEKRDIYGKPTGQLDLNQVPKWHDIFGSVLDAYERTTERLWGTADTSIRDRVAAATARQQAVNETAALLPGGTNVKDALRAWGPGPAGGQSLRNYKQALSNDPQAMPNMIDIASADFRKAAMPNGIDFNHVKANEWISNHKHALDELPPEVRAQFQTSTNAEAFVDANAAARKADIEAFKTSAAQGMLGGQDTLSALDAIYKNAGTQAPDGPIRNLANFLRPNPAAFDALKRDFIRYGVTGASQAAQAEMASNPGLISSAYAAIRRTEPKPTVVDFRRNSKVFMDNFNNFLKQNKASVIELFGSDAADSMMKAIDKHTGYKTPGRVLSILEAIGGASLFADATGMLMQRVINNPLLTASIGGAMGAHALIRALRIRGIKNTNDLMTRIMDNPQTINSALASVKDPGARTKFYRNLIGVAGTAEPSKSRYQPAIPGITQ